MSRHNINLGRRGPIQIIYNILYHINASGNNGISKTHIMYSCNLNWKQLEEYMIHLQDRDLIGKLHDGKSEKYFLSTKGNNVLSHFNDLFKLLAVKNTNID